MQFCASKDAIVLFNGEVRAVRATERGSVGINGFLLCCPSFHTSYVAVVSCTHTVYVDVTSSSAMTERPREA